MSSDLDYNELSFVISSQYRIAVMESLLEQPKTPSEISGPDDDPGIAHVSRALGRLSDRGLVELLVDESRKKGRIYGLSDEGEPIAEEVKRRNSN
jgi:predicted transcriptional regulator